MVLDIKKGDFSEFEAKLVELGQVLGEFNNKSKFKIQMPDIDNDSIELPNKFTVPALDLDKFLPNYTKEEASSSLEIIPLVDALYALAVEFGVCKPFMRLQTTVILEKKRTADLCLKEKVEQ